MLSAEQAGYRLTYLEVINWGTFNGGPFRLELDGQNALLTGANGAGKTTLLDALLTLLVPPAGAGQRVYNAAAGTGGGRGRAEERRSDETYVLGYYGQNQREGQLRASSEMLRDKNSHSVLLACFENRSLGQYLTAAQVLRYRPKGDLHTDFLLVPQRLTSAELGSFDALGKWKAALTARYQAEFFASFRDYGFRLQTLTGMREKALTLFGKGVALKELTSLSHFIRQEMLSAGRAEEGYERLQKQYDQLLGIDQSIRQATRQVELLSPLPAAYAQWQQAQARCEQAEQLQLVVQQVLSERREQALREELAAAEQALTQIEAAIEATKKAHEQAQLHKEKLGGDLRNHEVTRQLQDLQAEDQRLVHLAAKQQRASQQYARLATTLSLDPQPNAEQFEGQRQHVAQQLRELAAAHEAALTARLATQQQLDGVQQKGRTLGEELTALRQRPSSNIPRELQQLRQQLLTHLLPASLTADDLPFVGELLQVRPEAADWEPALEKLLREFALHLLVPAAHGAAVTAYASSTWLGQHLRYQCLPTPAALRQLGLAEFPAQSVGARVEVLAASPWRDWVGQQLAQHFPHHCVDTVPELWSPAGPAILTKEGLAHREGQYQKDDRRPPGDASRYVLGWDNAAKQAAYAQQLAGYEAEAQQLATCRDQLLAEATARGLLRRAGEELLHLADYADLDVVSTTLALTHVRAQEQRLRTSSNPIQELTAQYEAATRHVSQLAETLQTQNRQQGRALDRVEKLTRQRDALAATPAPAVGEPSAELLAAAAPFLPPASMRLDAAGWQQAQLAAGPRLLHESRQADKQRSEGERAVVHLLERFVRPPRETQQEFPDWHQHVPAADPVLENCTEFTAVLVHLEQEELPPLREEFAHYLREELAVGLINFRASLNQEEDDLKVSLRELNASLHTITFNQKPAPTFIRLVMQRVPTPRINSFRTRLNNTRTNLNPDLEDGLAGQQATFGQIKALIDELRNDTYRREVTDVRQWYDFAAHEFIRPTPVAAGEPPTGPLRVYENSNALSKGQRAQLTYTVLAAAVAYQFGINQRGLQSRSFRFLAVDEAFSDLDADNSRYLMELCQQLHLQLLVVTPLDKVGIVQEFIHTCHLVASPDRRSSQVYTLTRTALAEHLAAAHTLEAS
ncbi:MAG TPA: ATP-binding protein [Hymenobacter sp.]|uniref:ATP-binding protein n=1 Tax=Hymenobacter sp. TaxID=1898978 RepID=UPI002D806097|nr:ATP-binding protein [Hymenobacter sp.]HET9503041.1 ATP-binding protein [Hymenobacter sp.]